MTCKFIGKSARSLFRFRQSTYSTNRSKSSLRGRVMAPEGQTGSQRVQSTMQFQGLATVILARLTPSGSPRANTPGLQKPSQSPQPLQASVSMTGNQAISSLGARSLFFFFADEAEPLMIRSVLCFPFDILRLACCQSRYSTKRSNSSFGGRVIAPEVQMGTHLVQRTRHL